MIPKNITVLVYLHNNSETIEACLNSIISSSPGLNTEIIVIDDGSIDGSRELLVNFPNIKIISHDFYGIAKSINELLKDIGDNDVVRINGDVVIKTQDWLEQFQSAAYEDNETGIVGSRLLLADDRIESDGRVFINGLGYDEMHFNINEFKGNECRQQIIETDSVSSAFCYYKNEVIKKNGLFDENYFPFFTEDDDYCISARKNNFNVVSNSFVQAYHFISKKTPGNIQLNSSNENCEAVFFEGAKQIQEEHFKYWKKKWLWDLKYPDLNLIRNLYGNTNICWNIGEKLKFKPKEKFPTVDICIITCNTLSLIKRMMDSLALTDYPKEKIKIYITDNGSKDGTVEYLNQLSNNFVFEVHNEFLALNSGVTFALNLAVIKGDGELVARLDDDIILPSNWLKDLAAVFHKRPYCGMTGPKILNDSSVKTIQTSDFRMLPVFNAHENEFDNGQADYISKTVHIKGCCNLYRRDVFNNAGLFDIRFSPSQFDDPDHHIAVLARGYEIIYNGYVEVIHKTNSGLNNSYAGLSNIQANQYKLFGKWGQKIYNILENSIEHAFEKREINFDNEVNYPEIPERRIIDYSLPDNFINSSTEIINYKITKQFVKQSVVELLLKNSIQSFKSKSIAGSLPQLQTALNIDPSKIATIIFLYIAYFKLGYTKPAEHFKNLLGIINEPNVNQLFLQDMAGENTTLSTTISQFNDVLKQLTQEEILESLLINNQFAQAELAYTIFSGQPVNYF